MRESWRRTFFAVAACSWMPHWSCHYYRLETGSSFVARSNNRDSIWSVMPLDGPQQIETRCCIAGGGPAGMMLGFLLARAGVPVVVLEKHADFFRDFRGDTIHHSTLEVIYELGLIEAFLKRPHQEIREVGGQIGEEFIPLADLTHLPTHCKFLGFMPQWDFLDFIKDEAAGYPAFHVMMEAEVTELIEEGNMVVGVRAKTPDGDMEVRATLVVGADGRRSIVRERANLRVESLGAPIDV